MGVFGASNVSPTVIKADKAYITIGGIECLALGVTVTFERNVQVVPVINPMRIMSVSEPSGTININTLLIQEGNYDILSANFLSADGCVAETLTMKYSDDSCTRINKDIVCGGCVASSVSLEARAGQGYVASGVQITFTSMDV